MELERHQQRIKTSGTSFNGHPQRPAVFLDRFVSTCGQQSHPHLQDSLLLASRALPSLYLHVKTTVPNV